MTDNSRATVMVPFIDMVNFGSPSNSEWVFGIHDRNFKKASVKGGPNSLNDYNNGFILYNSDPIKKGSEVLLSYGLKTNEELLSNYGFTIQNNPVVTGLKYRIAVSDIDDIHSPLKK